RPSCETSLHRGCPECALSRCKAPCLQSCGFLEAAVSLKFEFKALLGISHQCGRRAAPFGGVARRGRCPKKAAFVPRPGAKNISSPWAEFGDDHHRPLPT